MAEPFVFRECVYLLKSTGRTAAHLREFKDLLALVPEESIFHHTCQYFLRSPGLEYTNDFAHWAGENLGERVLAEYLSNIDPYGYATIEDLRKGLLDVIDVYLEKFPEPRETLPGEEFYFNEAVTMIFPAGIRARNLAEFLTGIKYVDSNSIYYHFYEARMRLGSAVDDFSKWLEESLGKKELAAKIRSIDPFMHSVEGIRGHLVEDMDKELRKDMEEV